MIKVITAFSDIDIEMKVSLMISDGYIIQGGISTCTTLGNETRYTVIMIKRI